MKEITQDLFATQDMKYKTFQQKLVPSIPKSTVIGVRMPELRKYARLLAKDKTRGQEVEAFLSELPHEYYDENNLHVMLLERKYKNFDEYMEKLEEFLPYLDNWATCDMIAPKQFKTDLDAVYGKIEEWLTSDHVYTVRFGIVTSQRYFLGDQFKPKYLSDVAAVHSDDYYVNMAIAWYFSVAMTKQYEATLPYFTTPTLMTWTHNKALQKVSESCRVSPEQKAYLKSLKIKKKKSEGNVQ